MTTYIIKRILLMIPTLLMIALIIFLVLNLAPGRPGQTQVSADGMQSSESTEARESYRIFKEQFNFDKPILFNSRFNLTEADVRSRLEMRVLFNKPVCPDTGEKPEGCVPVDQKPGSAEVIKAVEEVEDWGAYVVPQLVTIAADEKEDLLLRKLAVVNLAANAQLRLKSQYGKKPTAEERAYNDKAQAENELLRAWRPSNEMKADEFNTLIKEKWLPWFEKNKSRFEYEGGDKVRIFFTDTRFAKYMYNLVRLDFGVSHVDKKPVLDTIGGKLKYSITLSLISILLAYLISVPLGVWSAYKQGTRADQTVTLILFMLYSLPSFFIAVVVLELFTVGTPFKWFPTGGFGDAGADTMTTLEQLQSITWHLVLPILCMTYRGLASLSRYARTGVLDVIRADYIRTARAKGLGEPMVIVKHAVRNGMIPILTLLGSLLPVLIGGSVIIEVIFNIPGMGLYLFESILSRDYNAIMAVLLISSMLTLVGLLVSDLSYAVVDPRISFD